MLDESNNSLSSNDTSSNNIDSDNISVIDEGASTQHPSLFDPMNISANFTSASGSSLNANS